MARKITKVMTDAFFAGENKTMSNTVVQKEDDETFMYLHNNLIAKRGPDGVYIRSAGWETPTTKERLNGILSYLQRGYIKQTKGVWNIEGWGGDVPRGEFNSDGWNKVK